MTYTPTTEHIWIVELAVDHQVQRPLDARRAERIARDFREDALGVIVVNRRTDGLIHIIDGQHRVAALRCHGADDDYQVLCLVYRGLGLADEAAMFRRLNNMKQPHKIDRFRVSVIEGERHAVFLDGLLRAYGWKVGMSQRDGVFAAVASLENLLAASEPKIVDMVLNITAEAWGLAPHSARAEIIDGLGALLIRNADVIDEHKLITELSQHQGGPLALIGKAKGLKEIRGGRVRDCMAEILVNLHNKKRSRNRLPSWRADDVA